MLRAAKRDENHAAIVAALRKIGCHVEDLGAVGNGCPDLLVGYRGRWTMLEVKNPLRPPSARKLTPDQEEWHKKVLACGLPVFVVETVEAAIAAVTNPGMWEV